MGIRGGQGEHCWMHIHQTIPGVNMLKHIAQLVWDKWLKMSDISVLCLLHMA
jgi:hypothetical protein